ncbi:uracil phosphoribosyltransferase [Pelagibius sp.]|uniref:uracil phosphoribosyltransferase n=1 Tax=Pelagibius sp. TaxID=1931238 RepID=UPI003BAFE0B0
MEKTVANHKVTVVDHPLVQHKLTLMRDTETALPEFRRLLREISLLLAYEVTRHLELKTVSVETPVARAELPLLAQQEPCFITILRAGNGLLDGMLDLIPAASVGHVGLYRDPKSLEAVEYYYKVPRDMAERLAIVVDPMLATGHTAVAALEMLKRDNAKDISFVCLVAAPEGIDALHQAHPDVPVFTAAVDDHLNEKGYIVPGLGDAGDRIFGTK